jgi:hypothetical protein
LISIATLTYSAFRRLFKKTNYKETNYFYKSFYSVKNSDYYLSVFEEFDKRKNIPFNEKIRFSSKFDFGSSMRKIRRGVNEDFHTVKTLCNTEVLYSKILIGRDKVLLELHFYKNKLVLFRYTFFNLENKKKIEDILKEKYLNFTKDSNIVDYNVKDPFGNSSYVDDKVVLSVLYFSFNFGFYEYIMGLKKEKEEKKLARVVNWQKEIEKRL